MRKCAQVKRIILDRNDGVQTLVALGLTVLQARVYLSLTKLGTACASAISHFSKVGRQDIYRILRELQDLGLVKKILTLPTKFEPIPIKQGVLFLLKQRDDEISQLRNDAMRLCRIFEHREGSVNRAGLKILTIPRKDMVFSEAFHLVDNAKESIKIFAEGNELRDPRTEKHFCRLLEQGRKIQIIIPDAENVPIFSKHMEMYVNKLFQVKYYSNHRVPRFVICDDREMVIAISDEEDFPGLHIDITAVLKIASHYFDFLWKESVPVMNIFK